MAAGLTVLTRAQLAAIGKYADVQFIWDMGQSGNLIFSVPYTDAEGTARIQPVLYINLATLFEVADNSDTDAGPGNAESLAQETHEGASLAATVGALNEAQAKALKAPSVIWVDGDPKGGTDLIWTLAGQPRVWVIDFTALFDVAAGMLQGHEALGQRGNGGECTMAQLASVPRVTVNFVHSGPDANLLYTVEGAPRTYIINLSTLIAINKIDDAGSHTH